jgi:hypothetical protein
MTYVKRRLGVLKHLELMDPRVLEATIDPPLWWRHQRDVVARVETIIDLSAYPVVGRDLNRISIDARDDAMLVQIGFPGHAREGKAGVAAAKGKRGRASG